MKHVWGHVLAASTLLAGVAVTGSAVSACVHDDSTIFVDEVLAPQFVTTGMSCTFSADPTQLHITSGVLDVGIRDDYGAVFLVGNQIVPQGNPDQPDTETSFVDIQGAVVRILDTSGNQLTTFTQAAAVTIPPSSGTTPGFSPIALTIIDAATAQSLNVPTGGSQRLISYTRFFGKTLGGDSVESNEFGFPVDICYGCLVGFSATDINPKLRTPNCAGTSAMAATSVPCVIGQDFVVDCTACAATRPVCNPNNPTSVLVDGDAGTD